MTFNRGLSDAFLTELQSGPSRAIVDACSEAGLDLRIRDEYVNFYSQGRSIVKLKRGPRIGIRAEVHRKYVPQSAEHASVLHRDTRYFRIDAMSAEGFAQHVPDLIHRAREHERKEEIFELKFLRANSGDGPLCCIDRQIQLPGMLRRMDVVGVARNPDRFVVIELKRGSDGRIQDVADQTHEYLLQIDPNNDGLEDDVATSYRIVATQLLALGQPAPDPDSIRTGMPVVAVIVIEGYNARSKLLSRARQAAAGLARPVHVWLPTNGALDMPPIDEWQELAEVDSGDARTTG